MTPVASWNGFESRSREVGAVDAAVSTHWADGGKGAEELAKAVVGATEKTSTFRHLYDVAWPIKKKIQTIATQMYGASAVSFDAGAERDIELAQQLGLDRLPICMAKTPLSLSHDPALKGRPSGFTLPIKEVRMLAGAGYPHGGLFRYSTHAGLAEEASRGTDWNRSRHGRDCGAVLKASAV